MKYFVAIVEDGSFSRAAARLGVAQPALSRHVRRMEDDLGTPLLLRGPTGATPTPEGQLLLRRARVLLADLDATLEELRSLNHDPAGSVRLGLPGTVSDILSIPLIARCRARYPRVRIVIAEAMSGFVREWLLDGRIDLAVIYGELQEPALRTDLLLDEELVLLLPPDTGTDVAVAPGPESLARLPLILPSGAHGLRVMIDQRLRAQGITVTPEIEVDSYRNIKRLVAGGYGASVLPRHAVADAAEAGHLLLRPFAAPGLRRSAYMARANARPAPRAAQLVASLLREVTAELIAKGDWPGARAGG
ncbi:LysR family transcriptional regulator [Pseudooceanicola aestuarii]|uniref:LysR family transcriptional regulator n=1 Tax=Pseudooceanicola aestuarii TaxID=2697319 RepID=UPI0013D10ABF|nr:LysR family transcriptional regulator [Pseudooceanicola aestuarii]